MSSVLPPNPSLEQLKNQAKDLLKSYRAGGIDALQRIRHHHPYFGSAAIVAEGTVFRLSDAQLVLAREYGFYNWMRLRAYVEDRATECKLEAAPAKALAQPKWKAQMALWAEEILALTRQQDVKGVLAAFHANRTRDLLAVRELLWQSGHYSLVVDILIRGLELPQPEWRYEAAGMMDRMADERCVEPLRRLLNDPVPRIRRMAMHSLCCEHCKIIPLSSCCDLLPDVTRLALTDPSVNVRRHTVYILAENSADPRAVETLHKMLQDVDTKIRRDVHFRLSRLGSLAEAVEQ